MAPKVIFQGLSSVPLTMLNTLFQFSSSILPLFLVLKCLFSFLPQQEPSTLDSINASIFGGAYVGDFVTNVQLYANVKNRGLHVFTYKCAFLLCKLVLFM